MQHMFLVRHGAYVMKGTERMPFEVITAEGRKKLEQTARSMSRVLGNGQLSHYMLSSMAPRAVKSSQIVAKVLGLVSFEQSGLVSSGEYFGRLSEFLVPHETSNDIVTIIGHESMRMYSWYVSERKYTGNWKNTSKKFDYGCGIHLDFHNRKISDLL